MKCFERIIKKALLPCLDDHKDTLQFAYQEKRSTTDACTVLQQIIFDHTNRFHAYVRILFIDYSSAFSAIIPGMLMDKLEERGVDQRILHTIAAFLSNSTQCVKIGEEISEPTITNTGAPQGCVLSPILFTAYTDNLRSSHENVQILKYADDTAIVGLITKGNEAAYHAEVERT